MYLKMYKFGVFSCKGAALEVLMYVCLAVCLSVCLQFEFSALLSLLKVPKVKGRFREGSGKVQERFRKGSGKVQGRFREFRFKEFLNLST